MLLVPGAFVTSQILDSFGAWNMGDGYWITILAGDGEWCWRLLLVDQVGLSIVFEVVLKDMVFALGEFQLLVGSNQNVMPQLAVLTGLFH